MVKFNVIIPSIDIDDLLINCIKGLVVQKYKNFFLSVIIEKNNKLSFLNNYLKQNKIAYKIIVTKVKTISGKRNIGASLIDSEYLAFIDSDAYPSKNWLETGKIFFDQNNEVLVVGGPSGISFENEKQSYLLTNYSKKSFLCTANLSKRKYSDKNQYFDWLESCNLMIKKSTYDSVDGMNKEQYIFEDLALCQKINKKYGKQKIYYLGKLIVYHKDRSILNFLKQRFVYGLHLQEALFYSNFLGKLLSLIPLVFLISLIIFFSFFYKNILFYYLLFIFTILSFSIFYYDIKKFKLSFIFLINVYFITILSNLSYALGNILSFFKLKKLLSKKIYSNSQS
ncbi:MAG: hypothetical protein CFH15_01149 [Alphaproteobacteria bacterium MarineAlpha5_Bin5]|nr:MAG: hypothetical protein CFH14_01064 [Alphaproteobacteria bacterium MarineAlpha5_Bin4]PPR49542.1 MAG: hypothetical protein CFH15_01149 [Alphaproteobacteria bacterium MarineAlpha5_Bin5]